MTMNPEEVFDKIQYPFMMIIFSKLERRKTFKLKKMYVCLNNKRRHCHTHHPQQ